MTETTVERLDIQASFTGGDAQTGLDKLYTTLDKISRMTDKVTKVTESSARATITSKVNFASLERVATVTAKALSKCFTATNDYVESLNLFNVAMGDATQKALEYAMTVERVMGINSGDWMNYQGSYNQIFEGYGLDPDQANQMSQQLTQLTYDLSSLWNVDTDTAFQKIQSGMSGQIKGLKVWGYNLSVASLRETALAHGIELSTAKMTEAQKAILRYVTLMDSSSNAHGDLARTILTPANSLRILKSQFEIMQRTVGQVVSVFAVKLIPVVQVMIQWVTALAEKMAQAFGYELPEIDYTGISAGAGYADDLANGLDESANKAEKLKRSLLGIDEINKLSDNSSSSTATEYGGGYAPDFGMDLEPLGYDFLSKIDFDTDELKKTLRKIEAILGGALLAVGGVLTFTGANIPLGLGLMAAGAIGLAGALGVDWNSTKDTINTVLNAITGVVGGSLLALGALLALSGVNVPLGIGMIAVGAVTLASSVALNWGGVSQEIQEIISTITAIVGGAMLAIGMILLLASSATSPMGIALLAAGAVTLTSTVAINWNSMSPKLQGILTTITSIVGGAMLALGAILTFLGFYPVGVACLLLGAASLVTSVAINWKSSPDKITDIVQLIAGVVGGALLVIGAVLAFSGVGLPLGIGLMAAGAAGLATSVAINWDSVKEKIRSVLAGILSIVSAAGVALGVLLCLVGCLPLGIGLIVAGMKGADKAAEIDDNAVTRKVKGMFDGIKEKWNEFKNWWKNLTLPEFKIKKPHISWTTEPATGWVAEVLSAVNLPAAWPKLNVSWYAQGGFPQAGEMFIANDAGPELVGTIGNKTAVANQGQIEAGIAMGVADANEEQNKLLREQNALLTKLLNKEAVVKAYVTTSDIVDGLSRKNRRDGKTTVPVGV